jgi:CBS domain-containing protein
MLAGVTRILVSVTVIMMTATDTPYLVACFMVASLFARVTGKWTFGRDGIYDIILELKRIPFLGSTSPANAKYRGLRASDLITSQPFVTLTPEVKIEALLETLDSNPRLADFVVVDASEGALLGVIAREDLLVLVCHSELFYKRGEGKHELKSLSYEYLMRRRRHDVPGDELTRTQSIRDNLTEEMLGKYLDVTPYISMAHYQFDIHGSCERAYELFRTLGLRTLVVTSPNGVPRGIICRYDLKLLDDVNADDRRKRHRDNDRNLTFSAKSITPS